MIFFWGFIISFIIAVTATFLVLKLARKYKTLDEPNPSIPRKIHKSPTPLLGGLAVIFAFDLASIIFYFNSSLLQSNIPLKSMVAIWLASLVLAIGGVIDDIKNLKPSLQIISPILAVFIVVGAGIGVPHITNPFGGQINLAGPVIFQATTLVAALFAAVWLLGMVYTTKFLDGLDGLATSISLVSAFALFALSFTPKVEQHYTALLIIIAAGAMAGFLVFNWHPAKIFLGESGSTFIGFILGVFAIIAGGKIATAFLVMGVPILDVFWVIVRRIIRGGSPFKADRGHLHFRLLDLGLSQRRVVIILTGIAAIFGFSAVLLQSLGKFWEIVILLIVMIIFGGWVVVLSRRRRPQTP